MHFTTFAASAAIVGSVLAGDYYSSSAAPVYTTAVYTSVSTCTQGSEGKPTTSSMYYTTSAAVPYYHATTSSAAAPYMTPVTYTSYEHITVTSCADYVTNCPAKTYTSAHYSTCTGAEAHPTPSAPVYSSVPYYMPPSNMTTPIVYGQPTTTPCPTTTPMVYATPSSSSSVHYTTVYTTVCPGANYCYGTTITTTYCPSTTPAAPATTPIVPPTYSSMTPVAPPPSSTVVSCPGGAYCPPSNNGTTPVYTAPPVATGAASSNVASFGVAGIAAIVALFIAA